MTRGDGRGRAFVLDGTVRCVHIFFERLEAREVKSEKTVVVTAPSENKLSSIYCAAGAGLQASSAGAEIGVDREDMRLWK